MFQWKKADILSFFNNLTLKTITVIKNQVISSQRTAIEQIKIISMTASVICTVLVLALQVFGKEMFY